ncbi:NADP-dependent phosphogluconate dehydrogenase [Paroceanicella profunda]|uniref:6-phosphogluconate dehydrogenase, decarboxylating n=1 Tax=Paroceanicella profunda TaxID=2579971 RepID=A0A5B8FZ03_9RHOB|nr:NADP-dependent phosphogluconate dehydrogenase [Paroceanicella profunda]QDL91443.1 NADP-dependent phosphogluconate dehydrogenase [Paroceanicella profunda]
MAELGLIGAGVMGSALALNLAEKGHRVVLSDLDLARCEAAAARAVAEGLPGRIEPVANPRAMVRALARPRAVMILAPAGDPTEAVIADTAQYLERGDAIADLGNADFHDTRRRAGKIGDLGIGYLGIGVSGGAEGARHGPAMMAGGSAEAWDLLAPALESIAASYEGTPCCTFHGPDGAGHFIKTVHNGIEYADMEAIAETYGLMRDGLGMEAAAIGAQFTAWNDGPLASYLVEIAGTVAGITDAASGTPLLDVIDDRAGQKGTGRWSVIEALHLGAPASTLAAAVEARNGSARKDERLAFEAQYGAAPRPVTGLAPEDLEAALLATRLVGLAQGFAILSAASRTYGWGLAPAAVARNWRAGCIIRSVLLGEIAEAQDGAPDAPLLASPVLAAKLTEALPGLRRVLATALAAGHPVPGMAAALIHIDAMRTGRGTANMLQGLRDYFGSHGFERIGAPGKVAHGPWLDAG